MNEWMNSPLLKNMDPTKLELIRMAAAQTQGKTGKELAPIMLALITNAKKKGIQFTADEIHFIMEILKKGKTKEEQEQIDHMIAMVRSMILQHR